MTKEEIFNNALEYFSGDDLAVKIWMSKYALIDQQGNYIEYSPEDTLKRISKEFARIEKKYDNPLSEEEIFDLLDGFKCLVPQGSPLSGIGNPYQVQSLSNCFVVDPPYDSYGGILTSDQELIQIMKRRGGVGIDLSSLRPKGLSTNNAARTTDGIEVFMERFSNSTREVAQGGRRGALMQTISVHHPQILDFINIKRDRKKVTGANISVRLSNEFLSAVQNNDEYEQRFPIDSNADHIVKRSVSARKVWDEIISAAHECAEPGLLFWDNIVENSPADIYKKDGFETISTNPCAELPLSAYDSCRLMVVNLLTFVDDPYTKDARFNFERFEDVVIKAQRLMDDLVDLEIEQVNKILKKIDADPEPGHIKEIEKTMWKNILHQAKSGRRTGLGPTAVGDTVAALGVKYGSDKSIKIINEIYKSLAATAYYSSSILAKERGPFDCHDYFLEEGHPYLERIWEANPEIRELTKNFGRRNISLTTTAPVGSISCLTQTTSGIEPVYNISYTRKRKLTEYDEMEPDFVDESGDKFVVHEVYHHGFQKWMEESGNDAKDLDKCPYFGATSEEIDWTKRVEIQATAQKWIDHGISSTCNLPSDVSVDVVKKIYEEAWKQGCKGFTVYRDGSRDGILTTSATPIEDGVRFIENHAPRRPSKLPCNIHHATIKSEAWTILVGLMDGRPYEVMGGLSEYVEIPKKYKEGHLTKRSRKTVLSIYDLEYGENGDPAKIKDVVKVFDNPDYSAFTRTISLALRHGAPIQYVVEQLQKDKDSDLFSFSKVIARVLKNYIKDGTKPGSNVCHECGSEGSLVYQEGCVRCENCGMSKCS